MNITIKTLGLVAAVGFLMAVTGCNWPQKCDACGTDSSYWTLGSCDVCEGACGIK